MSKFSKYWFTNFNNHLSDHPLKGMIFNIAADFENKKSWTCISVSKSGLVSKYSSKGQRVSRLSEFTKGYVNIPMYNDAFEARDLCKKILNDEVYRKEIVEGSQKCIEEKGRWYHRFKEIEEVINVKLTNPPKMKLLNLFNKGEEIKPALLKR